MVRILFIDLVVRSPATIISFYRTAFGFNNACVGGESRLECLAVRYPGRALEETAVMPCHGLDLYMMRFAEGRALNVSDCEPPVNRTGIRHLCVQTPSDRSILSHVLGLWRTISLPPVPVDLGTGYQYAYGRDPEGNIIELEETAKNHPDFSSWVGHVSITTNTMDVMIRFYSLLCGMGPLARKRIQHNRGVAQVAGLEDADVDMTWFRLEEGVGLELVEYHVPAASAYHQQDDSQGYIAFGIAVHELEEVLGKLAHAGYMPHSLDGGWFLVKDPNGNNVFMSRAGSR